MQLKEGRTRTRHTSATKYQQSDEAVHASTPIPAKNPEEMLKSPDSPILSPIFAPHDDNNSERSSSTIGFNK